jgi:hypothetical protein
MFREKLTVVQRVKKMPCIEWNAKVSVVPIVKETNPVHISHHIFIKYILISSYVH